MGPKKGPRRQARQGMPDACSWAATLSVHNVILSSWRMQKAAHWAIADRTWRKAYVCMRACRPTGKIRRSREILLFTHTREGWEREENTKPSPLAPSLRPFPRNYSACAGSRRVFKPTPREPNQKTKRICRSAPLQHASDCCCCLSLLEVGVRIITTPLVGLCLCNVRLLKGRPLLGAGVPLLLEFPGEGDLFGGGVAVAVGVPIAVVVVRMAAMVVRVRHRRFYRCCHDAV